MKLSELEKIGGLVSDKPVKKTIVWERSAGDEIEMDIYVKPISFGGFESFISDDINPERSRSAMIISESILFGDEQLPYEKAYQLKPSLAAALMKAINEVNNLGDEEKK